MKKIFKVAKDLSNFKIQEIEYTRKTDSFYCEIKSYNGKEVRSSLETNYDKCFETKEDAIAYMKGRLERDIKIKESALENAKESLDRFNLIYIS